jgi:hypothetical protein
MLPTMNPAGADSRIHQGWDPVTGGCRGRRCHSQGCSAHSNRKLHGGLRRTVAAGCHPGKGQKLVNKQHKEPCLCSQGNLGDPVWCFGRTAPQAKPLEDNVLRAESFYR